MAKVTDQSFDHDYDGIKEYDNPLPRWWVGLFVGCVVWAAIYIPYYHFGPGKLPTEVYADDMAAWLAAHPPEPLPDEATLIEREQADASLVTMGQSIFVSRCAPCHGADGGGLVGPNLTDDYSIHGYSRAKTVKVIHDGVPAKGMLSWKNQLSRDEIVAVGLYVYGLRGTKPANPKPPEGDPIVDEAVATPAEGSADTPAAGADTAAPEADSAGADATVDATTPAAGEPADEAPAAADAPEAKAEPAQGGAQ